MPRRNKRSHNTDMSAVLDTLDALALASPTHVTMIGCTCPYGPGGRDCTCCGNAPGKDRVAARRAKKRSKRQNFKLSIKGYYRSASEYYEYEYED